MKKYDKEALLIEQSINIKMISATSAKVLWFLFCFFNQEEKIKTQ